MHILLILMSGGPNLGPESGLEMSFWRVIFMPDCFVHVGCGGDVKGGGG